MDSASIGMKMETSLKEITLKTKKEEKENIIFMKDVSWNHSLILIHHRFPVLN